MRIATRLTAVVVVGLLVLCLGYAIGHDLTKGISSGQCLEPQQDCGKFFASLASLKTTYEEGKDLSKAFLTLIVATFVASITFSEKIVDLKTAGTSAKAAMITCWVSLLLAIAACGIGLVYLAWALGLALFYNFRADHHMNVAIVLIASSGLLFVTALVMMLVAAMPGFLRKASRVVHERKEAASA